MTELNQAHQAQPAPPWPDRAEQAVSDPSLSDPAVASIVGRLDSVPRLPVTEHEAVYAELHDALLQALNEDEPSADGGA